MNAEFGFAKWYTLLAKSQGAISHTRLLVHSS